MNKLLAIIVSALLPFFLGASMAVLSGRPPSGYDPATDANLVAWWKTDTLSALSNNDPVSSWTDSGANGLTMTQAGTARPLYITGVKNGRAIVRFDGTDDYLQSSALGSSQAQPYTIFIVFKMAATTQLQTILDGPTTLARFNFGIYPTATYNLWASAADISIGTSDTNWHIGMIELNQASTRYRFDGATASTVSGSPGLYPLDAMIMGAAIGGVQFGALDIGEVIWRSGTSSANEAAIFSYLNSRWAVY